MTDFKLEDFDIKKFDSILSRGLSHGLGKRGEQVCIEAAICETLGLPHNDDPGCVANAVRAFKISINDRNWSSASARANGLRDLGLAQLGSKGVVDDVEFATKLSEKLIRVLIPKLFRQIFPNNQTCLDAADRCEKEGTNAAYAANAATNAATNAYAAIYAANAATNAATNAAYAAIYAANAAAYAANAAAYAANAATYAANAAAYAANAAVNVDEYLNLVAQLALEVLRELNSPGIVLIR